MIPDCELLTLYAGGGPGAQEAFAELVGRRLDFVYAAALRQTRNPERAKDVAQTVFIALARKARELSRRSDLLGWLFLATRYASVGLVRSEARRQRREQANLMTEAATTDEPAVAEWERLSGVLDEAIAGLREPDRAVILRRYFQGQSFFEIGNAMASSENAARMRAERALEKLRRQLARRGITSTAGALAIALTNQQAVAAPASLQVAALALSHAALTGSALSAGATFGGLLQLMNTTKLTLGAAALVTALSVATAFREHASAELARAGMASAQAAGRSARVRAASDADARRQARVGGASAGPLAERSPAAEGARRSPSGTGGPAAHGAPPASPFSAILKMMSDPAMQRQTAASAAIRLDAQYGPLFQAMHLNPDQVAQFKQLLVEKQMVGFDSMSAAEEQGLGSTGDPRAFFEAVANAEHTVDSQIGNLLGPQGLDQFRNYYQSVPARNTANLLTQALSYTAEPIDNGQRDKVIDILTREGTPALPPSNPFAPLNGDLGVVKINTAGLAELQTVLSPAQMQALTIAVQQHAELLAARQSMGRPR